MVIGGIISHYRVLEKIASGGMGVIYKAEDTRLGRYVALKFLPDELAVDQNALDRFRREARAASALNHPSICTIYDIDEEDGHFFIAMELLEGGTLKKRINGNPLEAKTVLDVGIAVTEALNTAHSKGIIHRDINPSNIFITEDGQAKVFDFGLAILTSDFSEQHQGEGLTVSNLPTGIDRMTGAGSAIGTVAYMSPEQAEGESELDPRTDIFSTGVVLYEMAVGRHPFAGKNTLLTFDAILHKTPPALLEANPDLPPGLDRIIDKALEKDRDRRYRTAAELLSDLKSLRRDMTAGEPGSGYELQAVPFWKKRTALMSICVILIIIAAVITYYLFVLSARPGDIHIAQVTQLTMEQGPELDPAISPDGKMLAYTAPVGETMHIFIQDIETGATTNITRNLPGTHRTPRWSADGKRILFVTSLPYGVDRISVIDNTGGPPRNLVEINETRFMPRIWGPAWSPDGEKIAYAVDNAVYVLPVEGGTPLKITDAFEPHSLSWSPNGKWVAFVSGNYGFIALGNIAPSCIKIVNASGGNPIPITDSEPFLNVSPAWLPDSRSFIFVSNREGNRDLYLARIDKAGSLQGGMTRLTTGLDAQAISISKDGTYLVYSVFSIHTNLWAMPIPTKTPASISLSHPVTSGTQAIEGVDISRDEKWIVFDSNRSGNQDIYKMPRSGGKAEQLTIHPADDFLANFSPDGKWLAFYSFRNGNRDLYLMTSDGQSLQQITDDPAQERYPHWSPDGNSIVFYSDKTGRQELFIISKDEEGNWGESRQLTKTGGIHPVWSPVENLIAYFQDGDVRLISPEGEPHRILVSHQPSMNALYGAWSFDGKVLFYKANDRDFHNTIWSVPVSGGTPKLLIHFDDPLKPSLRPEFAVDSREILFTVSERESDIWILEMESVRPGND